MRTIWLVEDDYHLRQSIREAIKENSINTEIIELPTEYKFREQLKNILEESNIPDLVILDVMLPWTIPSKKPLPEPDDVKEKGFYRAGARCEKLFRENQRLRDVPVIIYTNLKKDDIENDVDWQSEKTYYLGKNGNISELKSNILKLI